MELETLVTRMTADVSDLKTRLKEGEDAFRHIEAVADRASLNVQNSLMGVGKTALQTAAVLFGVSTAIEGVFRGVKLAAEAEATDSSFTALIGNAELAKKTLADLREFALETPFDLPGVLAAAKQMSAFGTQAEKLVPTMQMLGDLSVVTGSSLKDLSYVYGTLQVQQRAYTRDLLQFSMRGIPIYRELAKVMGMIPKTAPGMRGNEQSDIPREVMERLHQMIEGGDVDFKLVEQAFKNLTGAGGQFFGQMDIQAKSLIGLFNQMREQIDTSLTQIGKTLIRELDLKWLVQQIGEVSRAFSEWFEKTDPALRSFVLFTALATVAIGSLLLAVHLFGGTALAVFSSLLSPVSLLVIGIVGLVGYLTSLQGGLKNTVTSIMTFGGAVKFGVLQNIDAIPDSVNTVGDRLESGIAALKRWGTVLASAFAATGIVYLVVAIKTVGEAMDALTPSVDALGKGWDAANIDIGKLGDTVLAVSGILLASVIAYKAVSFVLAVLKVQQIASIFLWAAWGSVLIATKAILLVWSVAVGAATFALALMGLTAAPVSGILGIVWTGALLVGKAATWLFNVALTACSFLLTAFGGLLTSGSAFTVIWGAAVLAAKGVVWLFNIALAAMNILLWPVALIAATLAVSAFVVVVGYAGVALWIVASAAYGAWTAISSVGKVLGSLNESSTPITKLVSLFRDFGDVARTVFRAIKIDSQTAWEVVGAGYELMTSNLRDFWPPFWTFLINGFALVSDLIGFQLRNGFNYALLYFAGQMAKFMASLAPIDPSGAIKLMADAWTKETTRTAKMNIDLTTETATKKLKELTEQFKVVDSDRTVEARDRFEELKDELRVKEIRKGFQQLFASIPDDAAKTGDDAGGKFAEHFKAAARFDAVIFDSAEALARIEMYRDQLVGVKKTRQEGERQRDAEARTAEFVHRLERFENAPPRGTERFDRERPVRPEPDGRVSPREGPREERNQPQRLLELDRLFKDMENMDREMKRRGGEGENRRMDLPHPFPEMADPTPSEEERQKWRNQLYRNFNEIQQFRPDRPFDVPGAKPAIPNLEPPSEFQTALGERRPVANPLPLPQREENQQRVLEALLRIADNTLATSKKDGPVVVPANLNS